MSVAQNHQNSFKQLHKNGVHLDYKITVQIPAKVHRDDLKLQSYQSGLEPQVSMLPLQSARIVKCGSKKRRINSQAKFIHINNQEMTDNQLNVSRIGKIKNVVYRNNLQKRISQQGARPSSLEETQIFQREKRFIKQEIIKTLRMVSPSNNRQRNAKKFHRTDEKKVEQQKKFKRIKQKLDQPTAEQKMIHAKLIKKIRQDPGMQNISRIAQRIDENANSTVFYQSYDESMNHVFSAGIQQSIIQEQSKSALASSIP